MILTPDELRSQILHVLLMRGSAATDELPPIFSTGQRSISELCTQLMKEGLIFRACDKRWMLTPSGKEAAESTAKASHQFLQELRLHMPDFSKLDARLKSVITARQVGELSTWRVVREVYSIDMGADNFDSKFASVEIPSCLISYSVRRHSARELFEKGDEDYLASPFVDSYHTVWFEWHGTLKKLLDKV
jgi:hypothetical protein